MKVFVQMSKGRKIYTIILCVLFLATLGFIWGNSLVSEAASSEESAAVYGSLEPIIKAIFGDSAASEYLLRKLAHIGEFFLLGLELSLLTISFKKYTLKNWFILLAFGIGVALFDETLQAIVKRGALITDVWIDEGGFLFASLIVGGIYLICRAIKNRNAKKDENLNDKDQRG